MQCLSVCCHQGHKLSRALNLHPSGSGSSLRSLLSGHSQAFFCFVSILCQSDGAKILGLVENLFMSNACSWLLGHQSFIQFFQLWCSIFFYLSFLMQGTENWNKVKKVFLCTYLQIIERYGKLCHINGKEVNKEAAKYLISMHPQIELVLVSYLVGFLMVFKLSCLLCICQFKLAHNREVDYLFLKVKEKLSSSWK